MGCCGWRPPEEERDNPKIFTWTGFIISAIVIGVAIWFNFIQ